MSKMLGLMVILGACLAASEHLTCSVCDEGTYCFDDEKYVCPQFSSSLIQSGHVQNCTCLDGYFKVLDPTLQSNFSCLICPSDSYCNDNQKLNCPNFSISNTMSSIITDCKCKPGYSMSETGTCEECVAGKFKTVADNSACTPCPNNTYSDNTAAISVDVCQDCPLFSSSPSGSVSLTECECNTGYEAWGFQCVPTCNQFSSRSEEGGYCRCDAGYSGNDGGPPSYDTDCIACEAGHFKSIVGPTACQPCPEKTYSPVSGTITCIACHNHSFSLQGSTIHAQCVCEVGFEKVDATCSPCVPGFVKDDIGDHTCTVCNAGSFSLGAAALCTLCPPGQFQHSTGASECHNCVSGSSSLYGYAGCECNAGFEPVCDDCQVFLDDTNPPLLSPDASCSPCRVGYYKDIVYNRACDVCPAGKYTLAPGNDNSANCITCDGFTEDVAEGRVCSSCPDNSQALPGSTSITSCKCNAGFTGPNGGTCSACAPGTFKSSLGSALCQNCPAGSVDKGDVSLRDTSSNTCVECEAGKYSLTITHCEDCPANTQSPIGSADVSACICNIDYEKVNGVCSQCLAGYIKTVAGNELCTACGVATYDLNNACEPCPTNTSSPEASESISACTCIAGHTGNDGSPCASCEPGKFKPTTGSASCTACGPGTYYSGTAPYIYNHCVNCPFHSESPEASYSITQCICIPGYIREENICRDCSEGSYCPNQFTETQCNEGSSSAPTSSTSNDCICVPGYVGERNNCTRCPVDNYCSGDASQTACPQHSTTLTVGGKSSITDCICNPGFYESNNQCLVCLQDHYCFHDSLITCPGNSSALQQQGEEERCICNEYFRKDETVDTHCVQCGDELVCHGTVDGITDGVIEYCSQEQPGHPASTNVNQRCLCPPGSFCDDGQASDSCSETGELCNTCPNDFYCYDNRKYACILNAISPVNSSNVSACVCKPGYYRETDGSCLVCPIGSFCENEIRTACNSFDGQLTTHATASIYRSDCICSLGFFRHNTSDLCKWCPLDIFCPSETLTTLPNVGDCQPNEYTVNRGSHSQSQCKCDAGFFLSDEAGTASCLPCARGELCGGGEVIPEVCHIHNRTANIDHTACVCMEGFEQNENIQCAPCKPGFFKDIFGNHGCDLCPDGTYSFNTTTCLPCRVNSSSSADRLTCLCDAPLELHDDTCVLCGSNQYYDNGCQPCPDHSTTLGDLGELGVASCHCNSGYYFSVNLCLPCPPNSYEHQGQCQSCGAGAFSPEASQSVDACQCNATQCQQFVFDGNCSGACEVEPEPCSMCQLGYNKSHVSDIGNTDLCIQCPLHTYQDQLGQALCVDCDPTRMTLALGSTELDMCICQPGHEGGLATQSAACTQCNLGHFKADSGNFLCNRCPIGKFTDVVESIACTLCSEHGSTSGATFGANTTMSDASVSGSDCICNLGYFQNSQDSENLFCEQCHRGSYKSNKGMQTCDLCGVGDFIHTFGKDEVGAVSSTHCENCPTFAGQLEVEVSLVDLMDGITDCQCFPGHDTWSSSACQTCEDYEFKLGFNNDECQFCADGLYFVNHNQACEACDLIDATDSQRRHTLQAVNTGDSSLRWGQDEADCVCDLGHFRISDSCHQCAPGSYRNETEVLTCTPCAIDTYQEESAALGCKFCPTNSHTVATGRSSITDCRCDAGYELHPSEHRCIPCTAGTYAPHSTNVCQQCAENSYSLDIAAICTPCAANERSQAGSSQEGYCNCVPGFGGNVTHPLICTVCPYNTFSTGGVPLTDQRPVCTACPNFKNSPMQSTTASHCKCVPGYEDVGSDPLADCTPCINGQYSTGGENKACRLCGFGSISNPESAATSFSDCLCSAADGLLALT